MLFPSVNLEKVENVLEMGVELVAQSLFQYFLQFLHYTLSEITLRFGMESQLQHKALVTGAV